LLSADEIRQVWRALNDPEALGVRRDAATVLRLILVTAARPGMVWGVTGNELRDLRGPRAWPALVAARRTDESQERVRHSGFRIGARTPGAASEKRSLRVAFQITWTMRQSSSFIGSE
jgi:hypothetical protein